VFAVFPAAFFCVFAVFWALSLIRWAYRIVRERMRRAHGPGIP
jgi:hypothetical protein